MSESPQASVQIHELRDELERRNHGLGVTPFAAVLEPLGMSSHHEVS